MKLLVERHPLDTAAWLCGGREALAKMLGVTASAVGNWKMRGTPPKQCVAIENFVEGAVTRRDLRPNDWHILWPELVRPEDGAAAESRHA